MLYVLAYLGIGFIVASLIARYSTHSLTRIDDGAMLIIAMFAYPAMLMFLLFDAIANKLGTMHPLNRYVSWCKGIKNEKDDTDYPF